MKNKLTKKNAILILDTVVMLALMFNVIVYICACSFKVEMGYHGQSGRDDRTQTELVQEYKRGAALPTR